jgi:hypothetical protein
LDPAEITRDLDELLAEESAIDAELERKAAAMKEEAPRNNVVPPVDNSTATPLLACACRLVFGVHLPELLPDQRSLLERALELCSLPTDQALAILPDMERVLADEDGTELKHVLRMLDWLRCTNMASLERSALVV